MKKRSFHDLGFLQKTIMEILWEKESASVNEVREILCKEKEFHTLTCPPLRVTLVEGYQGGGFHDIEIVEEGATPIFVSSLSNICPDCFNCDTSEEGVGTSLHELDTTGSDTGEFDVKIGEALFEDKIGVWEVTMSFFDPVAGAASRGAGSE